MKVNLVLREKHLADIINFFDSFDINQDVAREGLNDMVLQLKQIKKLHDLHKDSKNICRKVDRKLKS